MDISLINCYPTPLPRLIMKWKKGRPSLYGVRSAWVNGHSRIVEQVSLSPKERGMEQICAQFTSSPQTGERAELQPVQIREVGASALFSSLAQDLGLIDLLNTPVPSAPPGRGTSLSVGHSLVLAAINRALWPKRTRGVAEWSQGTVLTRLVPASAEAWSSQHFGDQRDVVREEHMAPIQRELLDGGRERFPLGERFLVYDPTNSYTFIHTVNTRPSPPQRGKDKQTRGDARGPAPERSGPGRG